VECNLLGINTRTHAGNSSMNTAVRLVGLPELVGSGDHRGARHNLSGKQTFALFPFALLKPRAAMRCVAINAASTNLFFSRSACRLVVVRRAINIKMMVSDLDWIE
jgi:hypothetical protein